MNNKALILAAGIGSRLYPLTQEYPKSLVKVNGREILDYQIQGYLKSGILEENIYIVTGYKHEMIADYLKNNYPLVNKIYSPDYLTTNNMYSLYLGLNEIKDSFDNFDYLFINNADCLYDENLMKEFVESSFENAIAVEADTYIEESMKVVARKDNTLVDIAKTISENDAYGVSVDLYKYSALAVKKLYEIVKHYIEVKKDLKQWTEVAFPELFKNINVYPFDIKHKKWVEVDNNDDLSMADKLFSDFNIKTKKALICDLDGTLYLGKKPIEEAIKFIQKNKELEYYFLTNNTSKIPNEYTKRLNSLGIDASENNILTPLIPLMDYIKNEKYKSVYLVANKNVDNYLNEKLPNVKFEYNPEENEVVVLTYDTEINYEKLKKASFLLNNKKLEYLATHNDIVCPTEFGPIPDIGSYIKILELSTKRIPEVLFGKPSINLVELITKKYSPDEIAVVGDRLYTDKKLADNMGCEFICVLSGETTREDVQNYFEKFPAIVVKNLGSLL